MESYSQSPAVRIVSFYHKYLGSTPRDGGVGGILNLYETLRILDC